MALDHGADICKSCKIYHFVVVIFVMSQRSVVYFQSILDTHAALLTF